MTPANPTTHAQAPSPPRSVQLFHTCIVNAVYPEVGLAVVDLLERLGLEVCVPEGQTCCGQPAFNGGFRDEARAAARHAVDVLHATEGPIVVPSGSCADMLVHHVPHLFAGDRDYGDRARAVAARCRELSQFLVEDLGILDLRARLGLPPAPGGAAPRKVAYHPSCHLLRGLGVRNPPRLLLEGEPSVETVPVADGEECCGFGGLFAVKNAAVSSAMLEKKIRCLEAAGAEAVVSCDMGCLMHLEGGLRRRGSRIRVRHLSQALLEGAS